MSDIVVSVNEQKLKELLEIYKKNFWGIHWEQEKYKWEGVAEFQDKWDINSENFLDMFYKATEKVSPNQGGLFDSQSAYPRANLKKMYNADTQGTRQLFSDLFDEKQPYDVRVRNFLFGADKIWDKFDTKDNHYQRYAVMTYLWLMYPDIHFIYKYSVCRELAKHIDSTYMPIKGTIDSIINSQKFYDKICSIIKGDNDIIEILQKCDAEITFENPDGEFAKKDYTKWLNTLVTDFAFFIKIRSEDMEDRKKKFKEWALKKGNSIGIKDATVNGYISALGRMWKKSNVADKMESPYVYGSEDIEELKGLYSDFDKNGDMADSDSKTGFKWYLEFLQGSEVVISDDENKDCKSKEMNNKYLKNLILYGPPGTGKTYNTVFKAMEIVNDKPYDNHDKSTYNEAKAEYDKLTKAGRIQFVTFHQSYSYEDFIEGIKPKIAENEESEQTDSGQVEYKIKDGVFKEFCIAADSNCVIRKKDKDKLQEKKETPTDRYVFIIDEINRGNISKIFGELITLIEETKREGKSEEMSAILPYSGDKFTVPDNVYIIGTMNTADRSLAVVDTALRRRFTFEEMMPDTESDLLDFDIKADGGKTINIKELLTVMNDRITALYDREHTIGHAYFMSLSSSSTIKDLGDIFKNKIIPLLQEYFYEDYEKIRLVLGDNQKKNKESMFIIEEEKTSNSLFGDDNILESDIKFYKLNPEAFGKKEAYDFLQSNKTEENKDSK